MNDRYHRQLLQGSQLYGLYQKLYADRSLRFHLSQIGEISSKVDRAFEEEYPEIPWRQIYGLRNRIVHDYEGVNKQLVWEIISDDLPALRGELEDILKA